MTTPATAPLVDKADLPLLKALVGGMRAADLIAAGEPAQQQHDAPAMRRQAAKVRGLREKLAAEGDLPAVYVCAVQRAYNWSPR